MMPTVRPLARLAAVVLLLLAVPLVAMRFTDEVRWTPRDFLAAGVLLFSTGWVYLHFARRVAGLRHKLGVGLAVGTGLLLVWVNLAVGLTGTEGDPVNLLYAAVLAVAAVGAALARGRTTGLARILVATAATQALVAVVIAGARLATGPELTKTLAVNAVFVTLWIVAALLLHRPAAHGHFH